MLAIASPMQGCFLSPPVELNGAEGVVSEAQDVRVSDAGAYNT